MSDSSSDWPTDTIPVVPADAPDAGQQPSQPASSARPAPPVLRPVAELAACHHDPLDGKGRFTTLGPSVPPISARVLAVCDRFEAMTSERPYRRALSVAEAFRLLRESAEEPLARDALDALERSRRLDA